MESSKYLIMLLFMLLFYVLTLIVLNRAIIYKSFKTFSLEEGAITAKMPLLIAGNISIFISIFFLIKPFVNFITYQVSNDDAFFLIFSISSIVFILNILLLITSYSLSKLILNFSIKQDSILIQSIIWLVICSILIVLTSELYNQITSTNAFNIY